MSVRRHSRAAGMSWTLLASRGLELDHRFSGHLSAMLRLDALRLCRSRTSVPSARSQVFLRPPGLAAGHRPGPSCRPHVARPRIPRAWACPAFRSISCSVLSGPKRTVRHLRCRCWGDVARVSGLSGWSVTAIRGRSRSTSGTVRRSSCGSASAWHQGCRCRGGLRQNPRRPGRRARHSAGWRTR